MSAISMSHQAQHMLYASHPHLGHSVQFAQEGKLARTYQLPFAIVHDGAITHSGVWLLNELANNDNIHARVVGDSQLHVSIPASELARSSAQVRERIFAEVDYTLETACQKEEDHRALKERHIDLL